MVGSGVRLCPMRKYAAERGCDLQRDQQEEEEMSQHADEMR
jgi:hypothetical protein